MFQLLSGLDHLSANRVLHRDLKSQNILITNSLDVKIADYGLSRIIEFDQRPYTNNVVSLFYRAPELLLGCPDYSSAIDIWSCGCILYELATKVPPFQSKNETEQVMLIFESLGQPRKEDFPETCNLPKIIGSSKSQQNFLAKMPQYFINSTGFDLMRRMFIYDQTKRITAQEAINHEFFSNKL